MKGLWTITRELPRLNRVGGVIHVTDRSHKYNAGWYRDEIAPVRFVRAGFYITRRQSDKCKVVQRYAPLSESFRRGVFIVRRKGMSKPPVKLGVDKSHLIEKERTS